MLTRLWTDEDGLVTVEYALVLSLIAIAGLGAWSRLFTVNVRDVVLACLEVLP